MTKVVLEGIIYASHDDYAYEGDPYSAWVDDENIAEFLYDLRTKKVRITIEEIDE